MKETPPAFTRGFDASYFDSLTAAALDPESARIPDITSKDCHTDLFAYASVDEREDALALFSALYGFQQASFRRYLEEELDLKINDGLFRLSAERKSEIIRSFVSWHRAQCLVRFFTDKKEPLSPLFLWEWCDGLAVACVQNEQKLREDVTRMLLGEVFGPAGVTLGSFLDLSVDDRQAFCEKYEELMVAGFQSLDSRFPQESGAGM